MSPATQFILLTLYTICFLCVSVSADETLNVAVSLFLNYKNDYNTVLYPLLCIALICLCVPILLCFPGQLSHLLTGFGAGVTNLNEPPRALATSTIMWVRS